MFIQLIVCTLMPINNHSSSLTDSEVENKLKSYDIEPRGTVHLDAAIQICENVLQQIDDQINDESESSTYIKSYKSQILDFQTHRI